MNDNCQEVENSNCLTGIRCPRCGSRGPFQIAVQAWVEVADDGTDLYGNVEWENSSSVHCVFCGLLGIVEDVTIGTDRWKGISEQERSPKELPMRQQPALTGGAG